MSDSMPWEVMCGKSAEMGLQAKKFFIMRTSPVQPGLDKVMGALEEHLKYVQEIEAAGKLLAAGPLANDDGDWSGDGMFVLRVDSLDEAVAIAEAEPMHKAGIRAFTMTPWLVNEGRITVSVSLGSNTFEMT